MKREGLLSVARKEYTVLLVYSDKMYTHTKTTSGLPHLLTECLSPFQPDSIHFYSSWHAYSAAINSHEEGQQNKQSRISKGEWWC